MAWTVIVAKPAQKQAAKFPAKDQGKIGDAIGSMADDPFGGDVLKLEGKPTVGAAEWVVTGFFLPLTPTPRSWR